MSIHKSSTSVALLIVVSIVLAACASAPGGSPASQSKSQVTTVASPATPAGQHVAILVVDDFAPDLVCNGVLCPFGQKLKAQRSEGFIDGCAVMDKTGEGGSIEPPMQSRSHGELITRELESLITALPATPLSAATLYTSFMQASPLVVGGDITATLRMTEAVPQIQSWQYQNNTITTVAVDVDYFTSGLISDTLDYVIKELRDKWNVTRFVINMSFVFIVCDENVQPERLLELLGDPTAFSTLMTYAVNTLNLSQEEGDQFIKDIAQLRRDPQLLPEIGIAPVLGLDVKLDDVRVLRPNGSIEYPGAYVRKLDGTIEVAAGAELLPDGSIRMQNQDVVQPEVFLQKPDGQEFPVGGASQIDEGKYLSLKEELVAVPKQYIAQRMPAGEVEYKALGKSERFANGELKLVNGYRLQKDLSLQRPDLSIVRFDQVAKKFVVQKTRDLSDVPIVLDELKDKVALVTDDITALPKVVNESVMLPLELNQLPELRTRLNKAYFTLRKAVLYKSINTSYGLNTAAGASAAPIVDLASGRLVSGTINANATVTKSVLTEVLPLYQLFQKQDEDPALRIVRIAAAGNGPSISAAVPVTFPLAPAMWNNVLSVSAIQSGNPNAPGREIWSYPGEVALLGEHPAPALSGLTTVEEGLGTSFAAPRMSLMAALYLLKSDQLACQGPEGLTQPPLKYANVHQSPKWENLPLEMAADRYCIAFKAVLKEN